MKNKDSVATILLVVISLVWAVAIFGGISYVIVNHFEGFKVVMKAAATAFGFACVFAICREVSDR